VSVVSPEVTEEGRDPRPALVQQGRDVKIVGQRCASCDYVLAGRRPRCPVCGGALLNAEFGPEGQVWAYTTVRIRVGRRTPPYILAYVDIVGGPRVLVHIERSHKSDLRVGSTVRLAGLTGAGDVRAELVS
jgi:uncharacterized OB-fold protein